MGLELRTEAFEGLALLIGELHSPLCRGLFRPQQAVMPVLSTPCRPHTPHTPVELTWMPARASSLPRARRHCKDGPGSGRGSLLDVLGLPGWDAAAGRRADPRRHRSEVVPDLVE